MKSISVFFAIIFITIFSVLPSWAQNKTNPALANYGLSGEAELLTHFILRGLSYSDNGPAMNASFLAHFGSQFKLGFWGSNVSNLTNVDDNFWLKIFGRINVELGQRLKLEVGLADDHFYRSSQRNGQLLSLDFEYNVTEFGLQWMTNYEGTSTSAEYIWAGKLTDFRKVFKWGPYIGYTNTHGAGISGYFDFKLTGLYVINNTSSVQGGITVNSNMDQFGIRDDPAMFVGLKLVY